MRRWQLPAHLRQPVAALSQGGGGPHQPYRHPAARLVAPIDAGQPRAASKVSPPSGGALSACINGDNRLTWEKGAIARRKTHAATDHRHGNRGAPPSCSGVCAIAVRRGETAPVFNVKHYGATGKRGDDARHAIQKAVDACAWPAEGRCCCRPASIRRGPFTCAATCGLRSTAAPRCMPRWIRPPSTSAPVVRRRLARHHHRRPRNHRRAGRVRVADRINNATDRPSRAIGPGQGQGRRGQEAADAALPDRPSAARMRSSCCGATTRESREYPYCIREAGPSTLTLASG